jgi:hypothetical protein
MPDGREEPQVERQPEGPRVEQSATEGPGPEEVGLPREHPHCRAQVPDLNQPEVPSWGWAAAGQDARGWHVFSCPCGCCVQHHRLDRREGRRDRRDVRHF